MPLVRILAIENNRRGDLFARLMGDFFLSLGYEDVRFNIARSGREIDIEAEHRLEKRRAIAECKATEEKTGGKEVNAFAGKLRPERQRCLSGSVTPFFISLSGFTETSIDQETESGEDAVILVDGARLVSELIKGRILVPLERATEQAGRYAASVNELILEQEAELLAHEHGWIWAIYYSQGKERSHFVLIHADGTPLAASVAGQLVEADHQVDGVLHKLICLNPEPLGTPDTGKVAVALHRYYEYLNAECGYIFLDGLPADAEVGTRRLRLENLFVPLSLTIEYGEERVQEELALFPEQQPRRRARPHTVPVGIVLASYSRLAILASPGGGKSTLLKRLAVAYADPARRSLADDNLPDRAWLPLFIRCRELRERARAPFPELLEALALRALIGEDTAAFRGQIDHALRSGEVLLLVDGLDEIADAGDRAAFVRNLRTFLAVYPTVSLVVTSREAGFRHVAGLLAATCFQARLADFNKHDVFQLTEAWHREVIGDRPDVIADAAHLAKTIWANNRIRQLAVNPLLLTTLLLVKRWVGQLPTRRSVLYGKAVEVLLMTWNVEAHEPIEQDEALPQLCYLAYAMMQQGIQKVSRHELNNLLVQARGQLAAELAFARIGVPEFIEQIEHRSSLLIMTGHDVVDGTLMEFYEFRHLTFQEYLTAKAIVEGWYPDRTDNDTLTSLLEWHLGEEKWREVIPLAAVLAGRKADPLITKLIEQVDNRTVFRVLGNCLADEVQATPETIRTALLALTRQADTFISEPFARVLARGKYSPPLNEILARVFLGQERSPLTIGPFLGDLVAYHTLGELGERQEAFVAELERLLDSPDPSSRCQGSFAVRHLREAPAEVYVRISNAMAPLLDSQYPMEQLAACWGFIQVGKWQPDNLASDLLPSVLLRLFTLWQMNASPLIREWARNALVSLPPIRRDVEPLQDAVTNERFLSKVGAYIEKGNEDTVAALVSGYYLRSPWNDEELSQLARSLLNRNSPPAPWKKKLRRLLSILGPTDSNAESLPGLL
ncbi:MAG: NACHT domain-containing protein [candidate division NC10 bacterium]|nr:NACHT domain-containing protein [candidate division NC10 bacterium]